MSDTVEYPPVEPGESLEADVNWDLELPTGVGFDSDPGEDVDLLVASGESLPPDLFKTTSLAISDIPRSPLMAHSQFNILDYFHKSGHHQSGSTSTPGMAQSVLFSAYFR